MSCVASFKVYSYCGVCVTLDIKSKEIDRLNDILIRLDKKMEEKNTTVIYYRKFAAEHSTWYSFTTGQDSSKEYKRSTTIENEKRQKRSINCVLPQSSRRCALPN